VLHRQPVDSKLEKSLELIHRKMIQNHHQSAPEFQFRSRTKYKLRIKSEKTIQKVDLIIVKSSQRQKREY